MFSADECFMLQTFAFYLQLLNHSELRASTPEKAAFYLDAALAARTTPNNGMYK